MGGKNMKEIHQNHMTSLRLPKEYDDWVKRFARHWNATPAFIYRTAIREFIRQKNGVQQ
jgi:predicted DNA-binding protein